MAGPRWWGEVGEVKPGLDDPVRELCSGEATEELTHLPMRNHIWTQGRGGGGRVCLLIRPSPPPPPSPFPPSRQSPGSSQLLNE